MKGQTPNGRTLNPQIIFNPKTHAQKYYNRRKRQANGSGKLREFPVLGYLTFLHLCMRTKLIQGLKTPPSEIT